MGSVQSSTPVCPARKHFTHENLILDWINIESLGEPAVVFFQVVTIILHPASR